MKTPRPISGILLLAFAFFFMIGDGAIGHWLHRTSILLVGRVGAVIATLTLFAIAVVLLVPASAWKRLAKRQPRPAPKPFVFVRSPAWETAKARYQESLALLDRVIQERLQRPQLSAPEPIEVLPPSRRMRLDDVRGALKNLGYKTHEYERVVAGMDPALPLETLVRSGLNALRKN